MHFVFDLFNYLWFKCLICKSRQPLIEGIQLFFSVIQIQFFSLGAHWLQEIELERTIRSRLNSWMAQTLLNSLTLLLLFLGGEKKIQMENFSNQMKFNNVRLTYGRK